MKRRWFIRWYWQNPLSFLRWQLSRKWERSLWLGNPLWSFELRNWERENGNCYCPFGSTSDLNFSFLGSWFRAELSRDWTKKPCHCDKIMWLLFPDNHECDIEEYGLKKLKAEYPGVKAIQ
jgi:hypothetical protein